MSLKAKVEAIIYATEEPVTLDQLASLLKDAVLAELQAEEDARLALNQTIYDGRPADILRRRPGCRDAARAARRNQRRCPPHLLRRSDSRRR